MDVRIHVDGVPIHRPPEPAPTPPPPDPDAVAFGGDDDASFLARLGERMAQFLYRAEARRQTARDIVVTASGGEEEDASAT